MKQLIRLFVNLLVPALMLAFATATPAMKHEAEKGKAAPAAKAEKGKVTQKVLLENDKVRVQEVTYKPGDENTTVATTSSRVVRALKGGTLMRTYTDGKTEKIEWKAGEARFLEPSKMVYKAKNVGKTDVVLYVVILK